MLRILAKRHLELTSLRTQAVCRLHSVLVQLRPGGIPARVSPNRASQLLRNMRTLDYVGEQRRAHARTHLADIRRPDRDIKNQQDIDPTSSFCLQHCADWCLRNRTNRGRVPDRIHRQPDRFATPDRYAAYNGTAPIEYSSGGKTRHRLSLRGNRKLNHAIHMAAVTQIRFDPPSRSYFDKKIAEGKNKKEALRVLKRRISDTVYRRLVADQQRSTS